MRLVNTKKMEDMAQGQKIITCQRGKFEGPLCGFGSVPVRMRRSEINVLEKHLEMFLLWPWRRQRTLKPSWNGGRAGRQSWTVKLMCVYYVSGPERQRENGYKYCTLFLSLGIKHQWDSQWAAGQETVSAGIIEPRDHWGPCPSSLRRGCGPAVGGNCAWRGLLWWGGRSFCWGWRQGP